MTGILPLTRHLGDKLGRDPIPTPEPISTGVTRPNSSLYSPETRAEIERILNTPDPLEVKNV